jgi:hypothetical protein
LVGGLLATSLVLYGVQMLAFHDARDTLFYFLQDLAFVPIQIIPVALVVNRLLARREKRALLEKMNMAVWVFLSEIGTGMIQLCSGLVVNDSALRELLHLDLSWDDKRFNHVQKHLVHLHPGMDAGLADLRPLERFLAAKKGVLLTLLANPNLLEHDTFTNVLWATVHMADELSSRTRLDNLPPSDLHHLSVDLERAHHSVLSLWLGYIMHLKRRHPYLYSFVLRTNPFDPEASPVVAESYL